MIDGRAALSAEASGRGGRVPEQATSDAMTAVVRTRRTGDIAHRILSLGVRCSDHLAFVHIRTPHPRIEQTNCRAWP